MNSGDLLLSLLYQRRSNTLEGIVLKLANLKKQGIAIGLAGRHVFSAQNIKYHPY